ncbi:MAG: hypothetical protein ACYCUI_14545 [Vulcanimicrobiaceae bacterium]
MKEEETQIKKKKHKPNKFDEEFEFLSSIKIKKKTSSANDSSNGEQPIQANKKEGSSKKEEPSKKEESSTNQSNPEYKENGNSYQKTRRKQTSSSQAEERNSKESGIFH